MSHKFWLDKLQQDFNQTLMVELFGPLDAKINTFELDRYGLTTNYDRIVQTQWQTSVNNDFPYLNTLLSFCAPDDYIRLYQRLKFQRKLSALLHEYWQWDSSIESLLKNWRLRLGTPTTQDEFNNWIQDYPSDLKKYEQIIADLVKTTPSRVLIYTSMRGHAEIMRDLLQKLSKKEIENAGEKSLEKAVIYGTPECVSQLIKAGVKVEDKLLIEAAKREDTQHLQLLIDAGANLHVRLSQSGRYQHDFTPFFIALSEGKLAAAQFLITAGANINDIARNEGSEQSAWHVAHSSYRAEIFKLLDDAKPYQIKLFYNELLEASIETSAKVIKKWESAGLTRSDLFEYLPKDNDNHVAILNNNTVTLREFPIGSTSTAYKKALFTSYFNNKNRNETTFEKLNNVMQSFMKFEHH